MYAPIFFSFFKLGKRVEVNHKLVCEHTFEPRARAAKKSKAIRREEVWWRGDKKVTFPSRGFAARFRALTATPRELLLQQIINVN